MLLRCVVTGDLAAYVAMRCDAAMLGELGGPQDPLSMPAMVGRDVVDVLLDRAWIAMIVPDAVDVGSVLVVSTARVRPPGHHVDHVRRPSVGVPSLAARSDVIVPRGHDGLQRIERLDDPHPGRFGDALQRKGSSI
jgi:hypothetical protein